MGLCGSTTAAAKVVAPDPEDEPVNKSHFDVERIIGQGGFGKVSTRAGWS